MKPQAPYNEIITQLVDKYGLTRANVVAEIEKIFSLMLSRWHKTNVVVVFGNGGFSAVQFIRGVGELHQAELDLSLMRGFNSLRKIVEKKLSLASCMAEVYAGKKDEHETRWGEIVRKNDKGFLVEMEIIKGQTIIAECPFNLIGGHELDSLRSGDKKAFHLRRINPILLHGVPRVKVVLDRTSRTLVTGLFKEQFGSARVFCQKRYVGHKSFVLSDRYIPKAVVKAVSEEIGEHIQILLPRNNKFTGSESESAASDS